MTTATAPSNNQAAKRDAARQADRERLASAVEALWTSEGWAQWVKTRRAFPTYSFNNQLLVALQAPEATRVTGFKKWQSLGRQVRKGEKAIKILAPRTFKTETEQDDGTTKTDRRMYFVSVPVFSFEQTEGDELPTICEPVQGDSHADYIDRLVTYAQDKLGYTVTFEPIPGGAEGRASMSTRTITVNSDLDANARLSVLIHECCHVAGQVDYTNYSREDAEQICEAVAMLTCSSLGLDTSDSSVGYIAGWAARQSLDALKTHAKLIDRLTRSLEDAALDHCDASTETVAIVECIAA